MTTPENTTTGLRVGEDGFLRYTLTMDNEERFEIPMREDGWVNATQLCKIAGKRLMNWMRRGETKKMVEIALAQIRSSITDGSEQPTSVIQIKKGGISWIPA